MVYKIMTEMQIKFKQEIINHKNDMLSEKSVTVNQAQPRQFSVYVVDKQS